MVGLRPVAELMYMDFALMASDQISNQAAKWHYMSGANVEVPLVYRASVGGGKGYGGQHSQTLESVFAHIPGLYVVYPATPYDAKGMLKTAIRDNNPVMFVESQLLYGVKGAGAGGGVPGSARAWPTSSAQGTDLTIVAWGPAVHDALKAADTLAQEDGVERRGRSTSAPSCRWTWRRSCARCARPAAAWWPASASASAASRARSPRTIMAEAFDYLDAPGVRVGAQNGIAPQSHILEAAFLPNADDIVAAARRIL